MSTHVSREMCFVSRRTGAFLARYVRGLPCLESFYCGNAMAFTNKWRNLRLLLFSFLHAVSSAHARSRARQWKPPPFRSNCVQIRKHTVSGCHGSTPSVVLRHCKANDRRFSPRDSPRIIIMFRNYGLGFGSLHVSVTRSEKERKPSP